MQILIELHLKWFSKEQGYGAGGPAGAGRNPNNRRVPTKERFRELQDFWLNVEKKKTKSHEQCELDENRKTTKSEIVYRIKENKSLVREAEKMGKD